MHGIVRRRGWNNFLFFLNNRVEAEKSSAKKQNTENEALMDRIDRKILAVLQGNARASLQEIGQAVGLSPSPC